MISFFLSVPFVYKQILQPLLLLRRLICFSLKSLNGKNRMITHQTGLPVKERDSVIFGVNLLYRLADYSNANTMMGIRLSYLR